MAKQQQQQPRRGTPQEQIEQLRMELLVYGFAAAKEIARLRGQASGSMACPLCQQRLVFGTAQCNGHFRAHCSTKDCINATE